MLDNLIAEDNPTRIIDAFVEELDLESLGFKGANPSTTGGPSPHGLGRDHRIVIGGVHETVCVVDTANL